MIDINYDIEKMYPLRALWAAGNYDSAELAGIAEKMLEQKVDLLSINPECIKILWPWLERKKVKLYSRFYLEHGKASIEEDISDLTQNINASFKTGASGAQVFLRVADLEKFAAQLHLIKEDLFFAKDLSIGLNLLEIESIDFPKVFAALKKLKASSLVIAFLQDSGDKSDFVGRIFSMLNQYDDKDLSIHFAFGENPLRIEQTIRLIEKIQPSLLERTRFFLPV